MAGYVRVEGYGPDIQPGEVTVVTVEDREAAVAAAGSAEAAADNAAASALIAQQAASQVGTPVLQVVAGSGIAVNATDPQRPILTATGGGGGGGAVSSVNGATGAVVLDADDVGAVPAEKLPDGAFDGQVLKWSSSLGRWQVANDFTVASQAEIQNPASTAARLVSGQRMAQGVAAHESIQSIVAGDNVTIDNTDPRNPILNATGGGGEGGAVASVNGHTGTVVLDADDVGAAPTSHSHAAADVTSGTFAAARLPAASETAIGAVERATTAEVQTGTDTTRYVSPAGLSARTATETRTGVVELATEAEALAGTDTTRAITPATLQAVVETIEGGGGGGDPVLVLGPSDPLPGGTTNAWVLRG